MVVVFFYSIRVQYQNQDRWFRVVRPRTIQKIAHENIEEKNKYEKNSIVRPAVSGKFVVDECSTSFISGPINPLLDVKKPIRLS